MDIDEQEHDEQVQEEKVKAKGRRKKAYIPKAIKVAVWNTYVGESIGRTKCTVCGTVDMTQMNFHCAHVVAEADGGEVSVANLRPTCATCNLSMGTMNLNAFRQKYFE